MANTPVQDTLLDVTRPAIDGAPAVWSSTKILEFDFAGIEQVLMGWFFRSPTYIRIAKLGTHAIVASSVLARQYPSVWTPADLTLPDAEIGAYLKTIKKSKDDAVELIYDQSKRTVHGTAYGLTTHGMVRNFPAIFPTLAAAEKTQRIYFDLAPEVPVFHQTVRQTAHATRRLGGPEPYAYHPETLTVVGHPYQYLHWFWSVVSYTRLSASQLLWRQKRRQPYVVINNIAYAEVLGEDAKRCVAMYPQGTARGVLTDAAFPMFDPEHPLADHCYVGDLYYGETPLRAPIHDSFLFECPTRKVDTLIARVAYAMQYPVAALPCPAEWGIGAYLTIGVDAKIGADWGAMSPVALPSLQDLGVANDVPYSPAEDTDEEDVADLEVRIA